ncbi:MAG: hypothetical protein ACO3QC_13045, partial [Phycisphaerales bacterium]
MLPKQADLPVKLVDPAAQPAATDDLLKAITEKQIQFTEQGDAPGGTQPSFPTPAPAPEPAPAPGDGG